MKHFVGYQLKVDKGKLTAYRIYFVKLMSRALDLRCSNGLTLKTTAFPLPDSGLFIYLMEHFQLR